MLGVLLEQHHDVEHVLRTACPELEVDERPQIHNLELAPAGERQVHNVLPLNRYKRGQDVELDPVEDAPNAREIALEHVAALEDSRNAMFGQALSSLGERNSRYEINVPRRSDVTVNRSSQRADQSTRVRPDHASHATGNAYQPRIARPHSPALSPARRSHKAASATSPHSKSRSRIARSSRRGRTRGASLAAKPAMASRCAWARAIPFGVSS